MYKIRMELKKMADTVKGKEDEIEKLTMAIADQEKDAEKFVEMLGQVDKHLKTLIKFLKNTVEQSKDPLIIEHTQK